MPTLPNVREISASYDEKYPDPNSRFNMKTFGPCVERMTIYLPIPIKAYGMSGDELTKWLNSGSKEAMTTKMQWAMVLEQERREIHVRVVKNVVHQVNAAIKRGDIIAHFRDPDTMVFS